MSRGLDNYPVFWLFDDITDLLVDFVELLKVVVFYLQSIQTIHNPYVWCVFISDISADMAMRVCASPYGSMRSHSLNAVSNSLTLGSRESVEPTLNHVHVGRKSIRAIDAASFATFSPVAACCEVARNMVVVCISRWYISM